MRDRRKELAISAALGFTKGKLLSLTFVENTLVITLGCLLGYLVAFLIVSVGQQWLGGMFPAFGLNLSSWLIGLVYAFLFSLLVSALPLISLSKLNLVEQLKQA